MASRRAATGYDVRITLVIASMACGGSERVMSTLANWWAAKGWQVTLLTFDGADGPCCYDLHPAVAYQPLDIQGLSGDHIRGRRSLRRFRVLRWALRASRPQAIVAFVDKTNVLTLLANLGSGVPVVISERVSPNDWPIGALEWRLLRRLTYPHAAGLVVQSRRALADYPPPWRRRARVIPNPAVARCGTTVPRRADAGVGRGRTLVAMGRLTPQKGFDLLLRAFAEVAPCHPDWSLTIWGDGYERGTLEALRDGLGLRDRASFPGLTREPARRLAASNLFVLSSRFEGFPNVLCEAMACGLPVVSFDCPTGPAEIIRDGIDGVLVPPGDAVALAAALDRLMSCPAARHRLAARAPEILDRFSPERVMGMWDEAIGVALGIRSR